MGGPGSTRGYSTGTRPESSMCCYAQQVFSVLDDLFYDLIGKFVSWNNNCTMTFAANRQCRRWRSCYEPLNVLSIATVLQPTNLLSSCIHTPALPDSPGWKYVAYQISGYRTRDYKKVSSSALLEGNSTLLFLHLMLEHFQSETHTNRHLTSPDHILSL